MRIRQAARLLIINPSDRVLLFRFAHRDDALAGRTYWATPGGGVENGESFAQAAVRELREETGIVRDKVGASVAERTFEMLLPSGETVLAQEHFFIVRFDQHDIATDGWSEHEKAAIADYRWWTADELATTEERVYPDNIADILSLAERDGSYPA